MAKMYTTLAVDPSDGWRPTAKGDTGAWAQFLVTGPHAWAVRVEYPYLKSEAEPTVFHGPWDEDKARRFARSCGCGDDARAVEVEPYYYCEAWGRVNPASVEPLDEVRREDWRAPLRDGQVLGSAAS